MRRSGRKRVTWAKALSVAFSEPTSALRFIDFLFATILCCTASSRRSNPTIDTACAVRHAILISPRPSPSATPASTPFGACPQRSALALPRTCRHRAAAEEQEASPPRFAALLAEAEARACLPQATLSGHRWASSRPVAGAAPVEEQRRGQGTQREEHPMRAATLAGEEIMRKPPCPSDSRDRLQAVRGRPSQMHARTTTGCRLL
jgi:hypothetical protein